MTALQGMKQEKRTLEDRLALVTARAEHNQETSRREERLMLSAMYEVGAVTPLRHTVTSAAASIMSVPSHWKIFSPMHTFPNMYHLPTARTACDGQEDPGSVRK